MLRDIDIIIEKVRERLPTVAVRQFEVVHPSDDDGIWWFSLPGVERDIQIESSYASCPFLIETEEQSSSEALRGLSVDQTVQLIIAYLIAASTQSGRVLLSAERYWPSSSQTPNQPPEPTSGLAPGRGSP